LAADLVRQRGDGQASHVLFIRLQNLSFSKNLRDALKDHPDLGLFPTYPLEKREPETPSPPLLLLFDGLDELAPENAESAATLAKDFFQAVLNLLNLLHGEKRQAKAVIAGRSTVMQQGFSNLTGIQRHHLYEVTPYHLTIDEVETFENPPNFLKEDQRPLAWQQYAGAMGESEAGPPLILNDDRYHDLSREPLLNCFIVLGREKLRALDLTQATRNDIYKSPLHKSGIPGVISV
jgi:hypothetical protein